MAKQSVQLDTHIEVITPENVAFQYRVAGPFRRFLAYAVDFAIRVALFLVGAIAATLSFSFLGLAGFGVAITLILWFVLAWFYGGILETYWNGQTVGKRLLGLRVLTAEGQPINGMQAVMRNILRDVDALPFPSFLVGVVSTMVNSKFQRLGDLACGTIVVIEDRHRRYGLTRIDDPEVLRLAAELPPKFDLPKSLGQALASYVERRRYFSPARRADIARHVGQPLRVTFGLPAETSHDQLLCALYYRSFITDQEHDNASAASVPLPSDSKSSSVPEPFAIETS